MFLLYATIAEKTMAESEHQPKEILQVTDIAEQVYLTYRNTRQRIAREPQEAIDAEWQQTASAYPQFSDGITRIQRLQRGARELRQKYNASDVFFENVVQASRSGYADPMTEDLLSDMTLLRLSASMEEGGLLNQPPMQINRTVYQSGRQIVRELFPVETQQNQAFEPSGLEVIKKVLTPPPSPAPAMRA